jgi:hypothetical protein
MDIPYAIQLALQADPNVSAIVGTNIFLLQLPETMEPSSIGPTAMPQPCAVVMAGGGGARYGGETLQLNDQRINVLAYGPTAHLAWVLSEAIYIALKNLTPKTWGHTFLQWVKPSVKGTLLEDPDLQWPYVVSSYQALASDLTMS